MQIVVALALKRLDNAGDTTRTLIALAPTPFFALLLWTMYRNIRQLDELQRRIMLESLAIGFAGAALLFLIYGQLIMADIGLHALDVAWVIALMILVWVAAQGVAAGRYR